MDSENLDQQLSGLAGLGDPIRRALYRYVAERTTPVSRDGAARAAGISRPLAAYISTSSLTTAWAASQLPVSTDRTCR